MEWCSVVGLRGEEWIIAALSGFTANGDHFGSFDRASERWSGSFEASSSESQRKEWRGLPNGKKHTKIRSISRFFLFTEKKRGKTARHLPFLLPSDDEIPPLQRQSSSPQICFAVSLDPPHFRSPSSSLVIFDKSLLPPRICLAASPSPTYFKSVLPRDRILHTSYLLHRC
ncbi:hypothetical protein MRB53_032953 [Persea americana]|uniref:Uncharacterized protein n=1 Tax=Persea americana TaxID=3435 RepID=A0ACC2KTJ5_PERAE|nr:hypothetical protein MRB53_032953 [Persea americana]